MILKGSQRGGAIQLANHLLNVSENDHVTVHELRGFVADDLRGALSEAHAISKATRSTQFMFHLSLNPPEAADASIETLIEAADRAGEALGLKDQPRALVIHEKKGRRHVHVVWSRIVADKMTAINLPHFKLKLSALSRELYLEHGWELPEGHRTNGWKSPLNFTLEEWQQAKRLGTDPREIKQIFKAARQRSDSLAGFKHALEEKGYFLARGDRRGVVALNIEGEVFSVARWTDLKTKEVRERLGDGERLPSVSDVLSAMRHKLWQNLRRDVKAARKKHEVEFQPLEQERQSLADAHRKERQHLKFQQEERWAAETKARSARMPRGLRNVLDLLTGRLREIRRANEHEAYQGYLRDRKQQEDLYVAQTKERRRLQADMDSLKERHRLERAKVNALVVSVLRHSAPPRGQPQRSRQRTHDFDLSP